MPRHVDVFLNGVSLRDAAPKVWVQNVDEAVGSLDTQTATFPAWDGERLIHTARRSLRITITATIHVVYDLQLRARIMEAVAGWVGQGGILTVSYRPDRRLRVVPTARPSIGKARDYTQEISIELTAYACPYWEDAYTDTAAMAASSSGSGTLNVRGTHATQLDLTVTPSAALTAFSVTAGGSTIALTGLSIPSGQAIVFGHTADGWLTITSNGTGLLNKRTALSADDLEVSPGANAVTWTAAIAFITSVRS